MKWKATLLIALLFVCAMVFSENESKSDFRTYSVEQFLNTKSYASATFTFDEQHVLFSSDEDGVFNIYSKSLDGKDLQKRLTQTDENGVHVLSSFPHSEGFLYSSDEGGNELSHIYLWQDGKTRDLTPYAQAKSEFSGWSRDRSSFYFTSNQRDQSYLDLYEMDIDTFTPKLLYKNTSNIHVEEVSPDKRYIALIKVMNRNKTEIHLFDTLTQIATPIMAHDEDVYYNPLSFSLDSKALYFLTNEDHEFFYLKRYLIESGTTEIIEKYDWDIKSWFLSYSGKYSVTTINQDGRNVVRLYDIEAKELVVLPYIPEGEISQIQVSKSEQKLLLRVSACDSPTDLYVYHLQEGTLNKLTHALNPEVDQRDLVKGEVIRYASYDGMLIPSIYYKPKNSADNQKNPALLWIHGGPGGQSVTGYNYLIQYLVNHGYAVLAVNNRGSSGYGKTFYKAADLKHGEADLDDCMWAKKYLVSQGHFDENKIGMIGGSYGGYMTLAALAFRPQEMAVGVDIFGVSNWIRTLKSIPAWWEAERQGLYQKIGNPETDVAYLESISPLFHAQKIVKPLLVLQGANDPRVLQVESDQIIDAVSKNGVPCQYVVFPDEGHGFTKKQNKISAATNILEFLNKHLK